MKFSEMNKREQKAYINIYNAANWLIGGLENDTMDFPEGSDEYESAVALLNDHNRLVEELYKAATTELYSVDMVCWDEKTVTKEMRDINFCGKEWLMERCEKRIRKMEKEGFCIG